ncbi:hypothetical protein [Pseudobutyrivibrio sp. 49]|uniref:hypothetical protein n=1 Tax=Pseudobutyrivibrio sp. 49 TaxID=1855344 RepID=UPI000B7D61E9|nr:hypothetical protein [Pseudobutyrivibrio sp. 49]
MSKINSKKINQIVITVLIVFLNFILQRNEVHRIFTYSDNTFYFYRMMRVVSLIVSSLLMYRFITEIDYFITGEEIQKKRAGFFWIYFAINVCILLLVWPGIFKGDEFYMIPKLMNMDIVWAQSWITSVFYICALMILPYLFSITLLQIFIIGEIASYIFIYIYQNLTKKWLSYFILAPFLLFPVLDNNQFTLRTSLMAWVLCFMVIYTSKNIKEGNFFSAKVQMLLVGLSVLLMTWKMEYGFIVAVLVVVDLVALVMKKIDKRVFISFVTTMIVVYVVLSIPVRMGNSHNNYKLTSMFTGLSAVLYENYDDILGNEAIREDFEKLDSITPVEDILQSTCLINLPGSYWRLPSISNEDQMAWLKSAVKICMAYPYTFWGNRYYIFKYTNGMIANVINHTGSESSKLVLELEYITNEEVAHFFTEHFNLSEPLLNRDVRTKVISILACRNNENYSETNVLYGILYNTLIPAVLLLLLFAWDVWKKNYKEIIIGIVLLSIVIINFILAPAYFWMYYMPFYLSVYTYITWKLLICIDRRSF